MRDRITSIQFKNYKAFSEFSVSLNDFNVLVGPNNAGKSTILGALRILSEAVKKASSRNPEWLQFGRGGGYGYRVELGNLPVSTENVFHNYDETEPARITFRISNGNTLKLMFPERGACQLFCTASKVIKTTAAFRQAFNLKISFVPVLGPVEHNERLFQREAARLALLSASASRNFRNIWHHFPEAFDEFRDLIKATWPGMDIQKPERMSVNDDQILMMFCPEERYPREIFWAGFGFQVWCQMLTFIIQAKDASLLVIDEPDIYLHSDLQRQLVTLLHDIGCPIVIATHSTEIISEVEPACILNVNKRYRSARRVENTKELQSVFSILGSNLNPALTQIAKTRRVLFVEGKDFQIFSRYARKLGLKEVANRSAFAVIPVEGFNPQKVKDFSAGMEATLGCKLLKAAIFDRDYRSRAEVQSIKAELEKFCWLARIHSGKEIENFLLCAPVLLRAIRAERSNKKAVSVTDDELIELLTGLTDTMKNRVQAQYVKHHVDFERRRAPGVDAATSTEQAMNEFDGLWGTLDKRLLIVPGKELLSAINEALQNRYGIHVSHMRLVDLAHVSEMQPDLMELLQELESFRKSEPPE